MAISITDLALLQIKIHLFLIFSILNTSYDSSLQIFRSWYERVPPTNHFSNIFQMNVQRSTGDVVVPNYLPAHDLLLRSFSIRMIQDVVLCCREYGFVIIYCVSSKWTVADCRGTWVVVRKHIFFRTSKFLKIVCLGNILFAWGISERNILNG